MEITEVLMEIHLQRCVIQKQDFQQFLLNYLRDIDKETVDFIPNFDDTSDEPTVLPAMFPNLLVNGSTGISAGYATDIPPHNLGEVIDGVIMRMDNPNCTVDELMTVIKGPDFPTGGIIQGIDGIKKAYETGKGKLLFVVKQKLKHSWRKTANCHNGNSL